MVSLCDNFSHTTENFPDQIGLFYFLFSRVLSVQTSLLIIHWIKLINWSFKWKALEKKKKNIHIKKLTIITLFLLSNHRKKIHKSAKQYSSIYEKNYLKMIKKNKRLLVFFKFSFLAPTSSSTRLTINTKHCTWS